MDAVINDALKNLAQTRNLIHEFFKLYQHELDFDLLEVAITLLDKTEDSLVTKLNCST